MKNAIVKIGAKQYRVKKGDIIQIEKINAKAGENIKLENVLMMEDKDVVIGQPFLENTFIEAQVLEHKRDKKIKVLKKKRRKNYRRTIGHRQNLTVLEIK